MLIKMTSRLIILDFRRLEEVVYFVRPEVGSKVSTIEARVVLAQQELNRVRFLLQCCFTRVCQFVVDLACLPSRSQTWPRTEERIGKVHGRQRLTSLKLISIWRMKGLPRE